MKKFTALILALCMVFALAACGNDGNAESKTTPNNEQKNDSSVTENNGGNEEPGEEIVYKDRLVVGSTSKVTFPFDGQNEANSFGFAICCDMLVYMDADGEIKSHILDSWESTDEGLTMQIKDGVTFTDGRAMTAEDILWTFTDMNSRGAGATDWTDYFDWDNAEVSDDGLTLFIPTFGPYAPGIISLVQRSPYIRSKSFLEEHPSGDEIWWNTVEGTGPYECVEQVDGAYSLYKLRDNYWGDEEYAFKEIQYNYYSDQNAMAIELENGVIDMALDVSAYYVQEYEDNDDYTVKKHNEGNVITVAFDMEKTPAIRDEKVREAIALAFNAEEAALVGVEGLGEVVDSVLPKNTFGYKSVGKYLNGSEEDIARAKELLAEAGYPDGFDLLLTVRDNAVDIGEYVQGALRKIGINCDFEALEFTQFLMKNRSNDIECKTYEVQSDNTGEPSLIYTTFMSNQASTTGVIFEEDFNELCVKATTTVDQAERQKLVEEIQDYIYDGNYRVWLYEKQKGWIFKNGVVADDFDCYWGNIPGGFRIEVS